MPTVKATFTADISQFRQSLAQATTAVTAFDRSTAQVNRDLARFGNEFSGAKIQREALTLAKAISEVGGVTKLTDAELRKANVTITEAIAKYDRLGKEAPESLKTLAQAIQTMRGASAQLNDSIVAPEQATRGFGLLQGAVAGVAAAITTQGLTAVKAFASDIVKTAGDVADLSAKTGLTTGQVQRFGYAAQQTGSSVEVIANSVSQLSNRLIEGSTGTVTAVRRLGLSFEELQQQSPGAAFEQIAEAIRQVPDPMQQTQLAMELFGRSGAEILPAIKQGMTELGDEAERLGLVIDSEAVQALDNFGDRWDQMSLRAKAAAAGVLGDTLQIIDALTRLGSAAANALPAELRNSPIGRRLQSGGPFAFGAASIYGAAANFAADVIPFDGKLPEPTERPMAQGTPFTAIGAAEVRFAEQQIERAVGSLEASLRKADEAAKQLKADMDRITGRDLIANATKLADQITRVGVANVLPRSMPAFVEQLTAGLERARELGPSFAQSARQITAALTAAVNSPAYREFFQKSLRNPTIGIGNVSPFAIGGAIPNRLDVVPDALLPDEFNTFEAARQMRSIAGFVPDLQRGVKATKDWRTELRGVTQAFAQLAQIAGPSMDGVTRSLGTVIASGDAAYQTIHALSSQISGLVDGDGNLTRTGRGAAGALAGLTTGLQLGSLFSNQAAGFVAGAAGGAVSGGMAGGGLGAGLGLVIGGFSGLFAANQNHRAQLAQMQQMREQVIVSFGTVEDFQRAVERAGFSYEYFLTLFNSSNPQTFTDTVNRLNAALTEQRTRADRLVKSLNEVARVQGVLSAQQIAQIRNMHPDDPAAEAVVAFAAQQRSQAEAGIAQAVAALNTATAGGTQNLEQFESSVSAVTGSMVALFDAAVRSGESAVSVLKRLAEPMAVLKKLLEQAGKAMGDGFGQLSVLSDIATGADTGPLVELAQGLGSALAGLANTGLLSPELFGELANGIGEAYKKLELMGKGGLEAARLMQPGLQAIWQMIQDNPALRDQLDDSTLALLDFAEQSGLIGEEFRPAIDRMIDGLNDLIDRLDEFLRLLAEVNGIEWPNPNLPTPTPAPNTPPGDPGNNPTPGGNGGDYTTPMALGGIVTRPTRALIGEAGPEAVIPLSRLRGIRPDASITIVTPVIVDGREMARAVNRYAPDERRLIGAA